MDLERWEGAYEEEEEEKSFWLPHIYLSLFFSSFGPSTEKRELGGE